MDNILDDLIYKQKLDLEIDGRARKCNSIPVEISTLDRQLDDAKQRVDKIQSAIQSTNEKIRKNEGAIKECKEQQEKYRGQLFKLKTNREYQTMNSEIQLLNEKISKFETDILELMEEADRWRLELKTAETTLSQERLTVLEKKKELQEVLETEKRQLSDIEQLREALVSRLDVEVMEKYARIQKKRGTAVAEIVSGNCGGCYVKVRPQIAALVRANDSLINCEECGRFLFWSDVSDKN